MNEADTTGGYVQIHVQLSYFGPTCTAECVEKVADRYVSLLFSYVFVRFFLLDFTLLGCVFARTRCSGRRSPVFLAASCQRIFRRMQAFMFASTAFSSHFRCFLVDETHHLHADLPLIKRPENSNWVSPPKKSKVMLKMSQRLTRKSPFWLCVLYFQWSTVGRCCHVGSPDSTLKIKIYIVTNRET